MLLSLALNGLEVDLNDLVDFNIEVSNSAILLKLRIKY